MDIKQNNESQAVSWEYIPDTDTLLHYLDRKSLIELSKCCKRYRNKLECRVLENLSLETWERNNWEICEELIESENIKKVLEFLETDLGIKLKFVKRFTLYCEVNCGFADIFVKLLPNIKTLNLIDGLSYKHLFLGEGLATILKSMKCLEHVYLANIDKIEYKEIKNQYFPKSIKSLKITYYSPPIYNEDELAIHNTIDSSYINLFSLTISSNRMLKNLACGMQNLHEVEIEEIEHLDASKLVTFLKANPQIRKLKTVCLNYFNDEIFKTILSSKSIVHWNIKNYNDAEIEASNLPSNYSIKYLEISPSVPDLLALQFIYSCKGLDTLDYREYEIVKKLELSKFVQKVNVLKLSIYSLNLKIITEIDTTMIFNQVCIYTTKHIEEFINKDNTDILKNYKLIYKTSYSCILKLISKIH